MKSEIKLKNPSIHIGSKNPLFQKYRTMHKCAQSNHEDTLAIIGQDNVDMVATNVWQCTLLQ